MIIKIYEKVIQLSDVEKIGEIENLAFLIYIDGIDPIKIQLDFYEAQKELIEFNSRDYVDNERFNEMMFQSLNGLRNRVITLWNESKQFEEIKPDYRSVRRIWPNFDELPWVIQYKDGKILDDEYHLSFSSEKLQGKIKIYYKNIHSEIILDNFIVMSESRKSAIEITKTFLEKNKYQSYIQKYELYDKN